MSSSIYIVYSIRNKRTRKEYIGQTRHSLSMRWRQHKTVAFTSDRRLPLYDAMREHGADAFEVRVLHSTSDVRESNRQERILISRRKTIIPHGYNVLKGGGAVSERGYPCPHGVRGRSYCDTCRSKLAKQRNQRPGERERRAALYRQKFDPEAAAERRRERLKRPGAREAKKAKARLEYARHKAKLSAHPRLKRKHLDAKNRARRKRLQDPAKRAAVNAQQRARYREAQSRKRQASIDATDNLEALFSRLRLLAAT